MKFYWFGDSWVAGAELELQIPQDQVAQHVFAKLVSDHYDAECINCGINGTSNDVIPLEFYRILDTVDASNDIVFFCLTASHRVTFLNEFEQPISVLPSINDRARRSIEHPYWKEWYKYFDNPVQRLYNYERTLNFLYHWCKNLGIKFYFCNIFTSHEKSILDTTTEDVWLLPKKNCLAECILPLIDNEIGFIVRDDRKGITIEQWHEQKTALDQFIFPCFCHPNLEGHKKIAKELIQCLNYKTNQIYNTSTE
jgi:hypothetical protein